MSLTVRDISRNADAFRRAYPSWPAPEPEAPASRPEITAASPAELTEAEHQMVIEDRWRDSVS